MRVVLELLTGAEKGRKVRLVADQTLTIGRTEWADFVVAGDRHLSSKHFIIEVGNDSCQLRDLDSANGTNLNGALCKTGQLKNGDIITAGQSQFAVRFDQGGTTSVKLAAGAAGAGGSSVEIPREPVPSMDLDDIFKSRDSEILGSATFASERSFPLTASPLPAQVEANVAPIGEINFTTTHGQLNQACSSSASLTPLVVIERLCRAFTLHVVVDFTRLGRPCPDEFQSYPKLFDWMAASVAATSPIVISPCKFAMAAPLLEQGWGKDAIVCVYSALPADKLVLHWRSHVRAQRGGVLGLCWPSVLGAVLANSPKERVGSVMAGLDLVMIEDPDDPTGWRLFSSQAVQKSFEKVGLTGAIVRASSDR